MPDEELKGLVGEHPFSFVGTVEHIGAAASADVTIDERTAVVRVDVVLHAPPMFLGLEGQRITVQLSPDTDLPVVGEQIASFADGLAFGETVTVAEAARVPLEDVAPHAVVAAEAGDARLALDSFRSELADQAVRDHVASAGAVVVGVVSGMEQVGEPSYSEHDPMWWCATIDVRQVVAGEVEAGPLRVLYPNSLDTEWRAVPKPKASQDGVWILHATDGAAADLAPWQLEHPDDRMPVDALATISPED